ncbi:MAG: glycosyltransferase [Pseudomonadota bacterium]
MIFVTVGTELPFDRLIDVVDEWAGRTERADVFAQIGDSYKRPHNIRYKTFIEPAEFQRRFSSADVIVSHAGMGTILSALQFQKPIVVMPRRASLQEHRNEHQLATARRLAALGKITVALDEAELARTLDRLGELKAQERIGAYASEGLITALREFIDGSPSQPRTLSSRVIVP